MYKAAIFDMDGVIIDSEPIHREITLQMAEGLGFAISDPEYDALAGRTTLDSFALLKEWHGFAAPLEGLPEEYLRLYLARLDEGFGDRLVPGVDALIKSLHARGVPLALASSAPIGPIRRILGEFGLASYFGAVISGDGLARPKPAPDIFLAAAEKLGVPPGLCVAVEDSENGVIAAKGAGMYCVGYRNPASGAQELGRADRVIDSFVGEALPELYFTNLSLRA